MHVCFTKVFGIFGLINLSLFPFLVNASYPESTKLDSFRNYILVDQSCTADPLFLKETLKNPHPKVIIRCHSSDLMLQISSRTLLQNIEDSQKKGTDAPRQVVRFGAHRFTHAFYSADEPQFLACWKIIYAQITLTSHQVNFYKWALQKYTKYPQYDTQTLISDYLHSQWNQDIFLPYSPSTMSFLVTQLQENLGQLPTLFQRDHQLPPTKLKDFPVLFYSPLSGWGGSYCPFKAPILKLLPELTNSFNAYDRLFCDAFDALNVTFTVSYNFGEFRWVRSFLLRDDLVSAFLPDPGALFYASPGITFVILKEHPILWNNVLRPFTPLVWGATIAAFSAYILSQEVFAHVGRLMSAPRSRSASIISKPQNTLELITSFGQLILTMAYSGMVLVGLLLPVYSWSPRTFQELNKTKRIFGATSYATAIDPHRLISTEVLNGITLWKDREVEREKKLTPGMYLHDDEQDEQTRYALLMDDDKKSLFIYGRSELRHTAKYINRLESARESVLQEMRYVSVAPSATKLHGVVATLKKLFQSGSWLRWKYLEDNYYKFVAPSLVLKQLNERCDSTEGLRSLKLADISTTFIMLGTALGISGICFFVETTFMWILNKLQNCVSILTISPTIGYMLGQLYTALNTVDGGRLTGFSSTSNRVSYVNMAPYGSSCQIMHYGPD